RDGFKRRFPRQISLQSDCPEWVAFAVAKFIFELRCSLSILRDFRPDVFRRQLGAVSDDVAQAIDCGYRLAPLQCIDRGVKLRHFWLPRTEIELLARFLLGDGLVDGGLPNRSDRVP